MAIGKSATGPRDVFLHLLQALFLYACVIHFGMLLYQYVNIAFPDPLYEQFGISIRDSLRWPLAMLTVVFPLFLWLTIWLQRDLQRTPAKRELRTRWWLLAFTLFLAALVIIGDLVTLLHQFLNGELTTRFLLKVLIVLGLALIVFLYYGWNFRHNEPPSKNQAMRLFVQGTSVAAIAAIIVGFFLAGSPFAARERRFDERRISDFSSIQWEIANYWQLEEELPATLDLLRDDFRGFVPPSDPATNEPYEYRTLGGLSFELCATFDTVSEESSPSLRSINEFGGNWAHTEGRSCFERTIDPDRFPVR